MNARSYFRQRRCMERRERRSKSQLHHLTISKSSHGLELIQAAQSSWRIILNIYTFEGPFSSQSCFDCETVAPQFCVTRLMLLQSLETKKKQVERNDHNRVRRVKVHRSSRFPERAQELSIFVTCACMQLNPGIWRPSTAVKDHYHTERVITSPRRESPRRYIVQSKSDISML